MFSRAILRLVLPVALLVASLAPITHRAAAQTGASIEVFPTTGLVTNENGGTATFFVVLGSRPENPVDFAVFSSDLTEGHVSPNGAHLTPGNWDTPVEFTVTGVADGVDDGDVDYLIITTPAISNDPAYSGLNPDNVSVTNQDDAKPSAQDDIAETQEEEMVTIPILDNDSGLSDTPLVVALNSSPAHGDAAIDASNQVAYTPEVEFSGGDNFGYTVCDTDGDCDNAQVDITVQAVNDPPQALDDAASTLVNVVQTIDVLANDSDVEGEPVRLEDFPANTNQGGTLARLNNGTPDDRSDDQLQYQPAADFTGMDAFTYTASDGEATDDAQVIVTVQSGPDAPVAVDDSYTTDQGVPLNIGLFKGVLANDLDPKGTGLTANLVTPPTHGTLNLLPNGGFTYTPALDFNGTESFTYQASDGVQTSNVATAEIQVQAANVSPLASDDSYQVDQDQTLNIPPPGVLGNDSDPNGDDLAASLVNPPGHGTLALKADGSFTYTPTSGFVGQDQFTYTAGDDDLDSDPATVSIRVRDTTVPSVNWVLPVETGKIYDVTFEKVNLKATASDNKSVARVRFYRWDATTQDYVEIGVDNKAPFTTTLDAGQLHLAWNQVFARAYDAAGNPSIQQYIWLYRLDVAFVPMTRN
jgi:hypothetical protein